MPKPIVLHLGDPIKYNHTFFDSEFSARYTVVRNDLKTRDEFIKALRSRKYGEFSAVFRPHFQTGVEMGKWDQELINLLPGSLKIVASAGAGYDWCDTEALGRRKIWYANGAGASDEAVSDTTLYMILSVFRNFTRQQLAARSADPEIFKRTTKLIGDISHNPAGHILGIVGLGNISKKVAVKAQAIGMVVHYYDIVRQPLDEEERLSITYHPTLDSLLAVSDCVTLHTPLNEHTKDLMNERTIALMKDGARLINTARGQVVEEEALVAALKSGKLSAVGLDVHYHEPQVNHELAKMANVTLTTHNGGGAIETRMNFELMAMQNILKVVGGDGSIIGEPMTPVNRRSYEGHSNH